MGLHSKSHLLCQALLHTRSRCFVVNSLITFMCRPGVSSMLIRLYTDRQVPIYLLCFVLRFASPAHHINVSTWVDTVR